MKKRIKKGLRKKHYNNMPEEDTEKLVIPKA